MHFGGTRSSHFERTEVFGSAPGRLDSNSVTRVDALEQQNARLNLLVQTLARLLVAKGVVSEQELDEWMRFVDGMDGKEDGVLKHANSPRACPGCGRMNPVKAYRCLYCDVELPKGNFLQPEA